jgi:hypothetical protein
MAGMAMMFDCSALEEVEGRSGGKNHSVLDLILVHACEEVLESGDRGANVEGIWIIANDMSFCRNVGPNLYIFAVQKGSKYLEEETTQVLGVLGKARYFIQEGTIVPCCALINGYSGLELALSVCDNAFVAQLGGHDGPNNPDKHPQTILEEVWSVGGVPDAAVIFNGLTTLLIKSQM